MVPLNKEKPTDYEDYTPTETDENRLTTKCFRKCACDSMCGLHTHLRAQDGLAHWGAKPLSTSCPWYTSNVCRPATHCRHTVVLSIIFQMFFAACGFPQQAGRLLIDGTIEWNSNLLYVDRQRSKHPKIYDNQMSQLRFRGSKSSRALLLFNISCGFTPAS